MKLIKNIAGLLALLSIMVISCNNNVNMPSEDGATPTTSRPKDPNLIPSDPVHIAWNGPITEEIESFKAEVNVYTMNSRYDTGADLTGSHRLYTKKINGQTYTRVDSEEQSTRSFKSCVTNGVEAVFFDTNSDTVDFRIPVEIEQTKDLALFMDMAVLGRLNLSLIRNEAKRLAFSLNENPEQGALTVQLPSKYFSRPGQQRVSTKAVFDMENETLNHIKTVTHLENGVTETTISAPLYQLHEGNLIKIGQVTQVEVNNPNRIPGFDSRTPIYHSPEEVPEIGQAELDQLTREGKATRTDRIIFGDPADQSYTLTIIEEYSDIEINNVDNSVFRMIGGGI